MSINKPLSPQEQLDYDRALDLLQSLGPVEKSEELKKVDRKDIGNMFDDMADDL